MIRYLAIASLSVLTFVGCGSKGPALNPVSGIVKLDGTPISGAVVTFQPVAGGTGSDAVGTTDENGRYTLSDLTSDDIGGGAVAGDYQIGVLWFKPTGEDLSQATSDSKSEPAVENLPRNKVVGPESLLPAAYNNPERSGLTATVVQGTNDIPIELDSHFSGT